MPRKDVPYFSTAFDRGEEWYLSFFKDAGAQPWVGEASTSYLFHEAAAQRIYDFNPEMRLIFTLRDPVERAYSNHAHEVQTRGIRSTFEEELDRGDRYVNPGLYAQHLRRYLDLFGRDQIHIMLFEDFAADEQATVGEIAKFLDVDPAGFEMRKMTVNAASQPRSAAVQRAAFAIRSRTWLPSPLRSIAIRLTAVNHKKAPDKREKMRPETRARLLERFGDDVRELESMFGLDLSRWPTRSAS